MSARRWAASVTLPIIRVPGTTRAGAARNRSRFSVVHTMSDRLIAVEKAKAAVPAFLPTTPRRFGPVGLVLLASVV